MDMLYCSNSIGSPLYNSQTVQEKDDDKSPVRRFFFEPIRTAIT